MNVKGIVWVGTGFGRSTSMGYGGTAAMSRGGASRIRSLRAAGCATASGSAGAAATNVRDGCGVGHFARRAP